MAGIQEALDTFKALARHADLLTSAYLENQGAIADTPENETAIKTLRSLRLLWQLEEDDHFQISHVVTQLLDHSLRNFRRHQADEGINELWRHLNQHLIHQYQYANKQGLFRDRERLTRDIQENLYELIEQLKLATLKYAYYITGGFTYILDLELRVKENERVIEQARKLNDLLESFRIEELQKIAGQDPLLRRLLLKHLPQTLEHCRRELVDSLHKLSALLVNLRKNVRQARLIGEFESRYERQPGWQPDFNRFTGVPRCLNIAEPILGQHRASLSDIRQEEALSELTQKLHKSSTELEPEDTALQLEDASNLEPLAADPCQVLASADVLFESLLESTGEMTASEAHQFFELDCSQDIWLLTLMNSFHSLAPEKRRQLHLEYIEDPDQLFPDRFWTRDLRIGNRL